MNPNLRQNIPAPGNSEPIIFCIDDEKEVLSSLRRCFRNEPYRIFTAASAEEAFPRMETGAGMDLVLADERLPGETGTELLRKVRDRFPGTARALLTAFPSEILVQKGLEAGVEGFLYKPWDDARLRDTVRRILLGRRSRRSDPEPEPEEPRKLPFDLGGEG